MLIRVKQLQQRNGATRIRGAGVGRRPAALVLSAVLCAQGALAAAASPAPFYANTFAKPPSAGPGRAGAAAKSSSIVPVSLMLPVARPNPSTAMK